MTRKTTFYDALDLDAAFEAVKGQLFGPLDPVQVRLKFKEVVEIAREKREQEMDPRAGRSLARDDRAERDRKDWNEQIRTLTWLLANDARYREAHERAMDSLNAAGLALARAIEAGERASDRLRRGMEDYLGSTPRLKDGRYVLVDDDGTYRDQNRDIISAGDAAEVDGQPKRAFKPYDEMRERKDGIDRDLAELRGWDVEVGGMRNEATDEKNPAGRARLGEMTERADELAERAREKQSGLEAIAPNTNAASDKVEEKVSQTAAIVMPRLP
ncbi:hypothetical protein K9U40_13715 [Xanthobacter autotrophicus]|uniref:hypothetical protein n=1 Tax=Xanthobacter TaxID=279 RepID=UPI0024ABA6AC|nr:hypothetical protein [Xanthobacter autotrophicus]MDI4665377.1 hypothetical protein [Xanthobacter autotrophicus]